MGLLPASAELEGLRILLVEDELLLAMGVQDDLTSAGATVLGPFTRLAEALSAARDNRFDIAVLDINLNGEMIYPLADELAERGIAAILLTGYNASNLPERFRARPRIDKPHDKAELIKIIRQHACR